MKILLIIDFFAFDNRGGAGTIFYEYAKGLSKAGHDVYAIFRRENENMPLEVFIDGIHFHAYENNHKNFFLYTFSCIFNSYRLFKRLNDQTPFDVISIQHPLPAAGICLSTKGRGVPKIYSFQAPWEMEYKGHKVKAGAGIIVNSWYKLNLLARRWVERIAVNNSVKVIVLSDFMKTLLTREHKTDENKIAVIPGGIDITSFKPAKDRSEIRGRLDIPKDKLILLSVRRLVPRMGLDNLINAMPLIVEKRKDILLIIGGRGPSEASLKELVNKLGLAEYISFPGFISPEDLPLYYQSADFFILPTVELEGFGLVTLEALASGLPVLGTNIGATPEILSGFSQNYIFAGTDPVSMAKLILEHINKEGAEDLRGSCRQFAVSNYSWDVIIPRIESLFTGLVKH